jgi:hypothetical protein
MATTRDELVRMLDELEAKLPGLIAEYEQDGDFWNAFAGEADVIQDSASADDAAYVSGRIDCMLGAQGLIPSENEGETCS